MKSLNGLRATVILALLASSNEICLSQSVSSGPAAIRKADPVNIGNSNGTNPMPPISSTRTIANPEMRGNMMEKHYLSRPNSTNDFDFCKAENTQIANLTSLNRLLEEKIKELTDSKTAKK